MQFPRTEAEIAKLGEIVVQGLDQATEDFPAPPVPPADLRRLKPRLGQLSLKRHRLTRRLGDSQSAERRLGFQRRRHFGM